MEHKSTTPAAQPVQPAPYAAGTGSAPLLNREAEFACMSYRERLALSTATPIPTAACGKSKRDE